MYSLDNDISLTMASHLFVLLSFLSCHLGTHCWIKTIAFTQHRNSFQCEVISSCMVYGPYVSNVEQSLTV